MSSLTCDLSDDVLNKTYNLFGSMLLKAFDLSAGHALILIDSFQAFDLSDGLTCSKTVARILKNIFEKTLSVGLLSK